MRVNEMCVNQMVSVHGKIQEGKFQCIVNLHSVCQMIIRGGWKFSKVFISSHIEASYIKNGDNQIVVNFNEFGKSWKL